LKKTSVAAEVSELKTSISFKVIFPEQFKFSVLIFFERKFKRVVFPAPEPPIIAKASPVFTKPDTFFKRVFVFFKSAFFKQLPIGFAFILMFSHFNSKVFLYSFLDLCGLFKCVFSFSKKK